MRSLIGKFEEVYDAGDIIFHTCLQVNSKNESIVVIYIGSSLHHHALNQFWHTLFMSALWLTRELWTLKSCKLSPIANSVTDIALWT